MAVTIYSTPTCPYCKIAKEFFEKNGVEYLDVNVAADQNEAKLMVEKSGQMGVPVIVIPSQMAATGQEEIIVGYDREKLIEVLAIETKL
ncbi:MAG: NrdH-redoxin [Candidatus Kerfeldbacteria bacterium CG15_BIG_FIL_POST_REV_8_21_14_020_45_12]|uniref:NrdH-redoxin n=1 Tax=Candidatus Kerfeldbacteria bacterium CG15_BIG_FIL_POST_REV_8_21_14_020_45_12 TaxID=2014247 RepID=A0A2M7H451_9BACT|nr:MAG: NrdH-redoxin [Candidatus Kerfeldbacteria bacterium CG15_BIG_FIL_POST_REV_8_21_14_020_45_12]PJA93666.1 MAG: NrdH-redoxin [Candidatus Kerfeldbacteria bacterium CG_4_9_14_3_um_filter_45_8]